MSTLASVQQATDYRRTIPTDQDVLIRANPRRQSLALQVVGTEGSLLFCLDRSTQGGQKGRLLHPAPAENRAGGCWQCEGYTGPVTLRAVGAAVEVAIVEARS